MLTRRHFIRNSAMALPLMSLSGFLLSSCRKQIDKPERKSYKIGIIGGGIAGLHAAKILSERFHYEIEILEAGDRVGGRIFSNEKAFGNFNVELGASAVYGEDNDWYKMMRCSNPLEINSETAATYYINGNSTTTAELESDQEYLYMQDQLRNMGDFNGSSDVTVSDYMQINNIPERVKFIFKDISEEMFGTSIDRASVKLNSTENVDKILSSKFLSTTESFYQVIKREYADILPFTLTNTPIAAIDYSNEKIRVTDKNQVIREYDKVIVTVPLSILKLSETHANGIHFTPSLPENKLKAMEKLGMDSGVRVVMNLNKKFWHYDSKTVYTNGSIGKFDVIHEDLLSNQYIISATVSGALAEKNLDMKSEVEIIDMIKDEWNQSIGSAAANSITDYKITYWSKDPFIRGTFSYHKAGSGADSRTELAKSIEDKIFFAGEACHDGNKSGTIHGAMETALKSANEIASILK